MPAAVGWAFLGGEVQPQLRGDATHWHNEFAYPDAAMC